MTTLGRGPGLIGVIRGDGAGVLGGVAVSPDGQTVAAYDDASRMWFHDIGTARTRAVVAAQAPGRGLHSAGGVAFHPGGGPIAVALATTDRPARLFDPVTFEETTVQLGGFPAGRLQPWDVAYSPDGSTLAVVFDRFTRRRSGVADQSLVVVWATDAPSEPALVLEGLPRFTHGLEFSPNRRQLFTGTHEAPPAFDGEAAISVYDVASGTLDRTMAVPSHPFALHPGGDRIAAPVRAPLGSTGADGADERLHQIAIMDATGAEQQRLRGHTAPVRDLAFSPDGALLASASADGTIGVWDWEAGLLREQFAGHAGPVTGVAFAPDGRTIHSVGQDRTVLVWDLSGARRFVPVRRIDGFAARGSRFALREPHALFSPAADRLVYVWSESADGERPRTRLQFVDAASGRATSVVEAQHLFAAVAWHPDGRRLASSGLRDRRVRVWDAHTGTLLDESTHGVLGGLGATYLGEGDELALGFRGGGLQRVDAETFQQVADRFVVTPTGIDALAYASPDGRTVAIVTNDAARNPMSRSTEDFLFVSDDRLVLADVDGHQLHAVDLGFDAEWAAFSPDGARVAVTGRGGQVALVDVASGALVRPPTVGHDGNVTSVDYSPDGATIVSGGVDGRVTLWDGRTGVVQTSVQVAPAHEHGLAVAFDPDGQTVTAASWDGKIHRLDIRPGQWAAAACNIVNRNLTRDEWRDAFGDRPWRPTCPVG